MKLYWGPHTCAIGIHVLLEEIGAPYELEKLDIEGGEQKRQPFTDINPKSKVPTLVRDDGEVITEFGTIAAWLASTYKDAGLLPFEDLERQTRLYEAMDYLVGTIHGQAFHRLFMPLQYTAGDEDPKKLEAVKAEGKKMAEDGFGVLSRTFEGPFVVGEQFTIADAAFFYAERWTPQTGVATAGKARGSPFTPEGEA